MNIVITGSNRGIGLELCRQLSSKNQIYALCRQSSTELQSLTNVTVIDAVDVKDVESIKKSAEACPDNIDILINNAGILNRVSLDDWNEVDMNAHWQVNAMGPLRVAHAFLPKMNKNSKIILITSRMGSIQDNESGSHYAYRMSKAALNMAGKSLAIDCREQNIHVGIIHPGWVQTDMTGNTGHYTVDIAASQIIDRIHELNASNSGIFLHSNGDHLPW